MHPSRFDPAGPSGRQDPKGRDFHRPRPGETPERTTFNTPTKGSRKTGLTSPIGASPHLGSDRTRSRDEPSSRSNGAGSAGALSDHSPAASVISSASTMWYDANGTRFTPAGQTPGAPNDLRGKPRSCSHESRPWCIREFRHWRSAARWPYGRRGGPFESGPSSSKSALRQSGLSHTGVKPAKPSSSAVLVTTAGRRQRPA